MKCHLSLRRLKGKRLASETMTGTPLTPRREKFIAEYAACGNATEAARRAGYSQRSAKQLGSRLTKVDQIQRLVTEKRQQDAIRLELEKEDVLAGLLQVVELGRERGDAAPMVRALVEVAKLCGFYDPEVVKIPLSGEAERLKRKYTAMSDDELLEILAAKK